MIRSEPFQEEEETPELLSLLCEDLGRRKAWRGPSAGVHAPETFILDLPSPELWEINVCSLSYLAHGILL